VAIDRAEVRRISELAHLELDEAAVDSLTRDLESILDHVALLDGLDVSEVDPTAATAKSTSRTRDDIPRSCLSNDDALANAPSAADGHFRVPRVFAE
jgi:aspartyl-tRNA(Asn)/glutamyl-tRNA(Gln) amidotransferase subunit C